MAAPTFMEYHLPAHRVLERARACNVSLTSYVIAAVICAIRQEMPSRDRHRAIRMDVPVDLRQHFESTTVKNFFGLAFVSYVPGDEDEPVEAVAAHVHAQLKAGTGAEQLKPRMNRMIALEKNPFLRLAPLFVKDFALELADRLASRETTTTVSSLGLIRLDERIAPYVHGISALTSTTGINFLLCSYGDDLSIGISTAYSNPDVVKNFCRFFSAQGIEGLVHINKTSEEVAEDRLETKLETSVKRLGSQAPARSPEPEGSAPDVRPEAADGRKGGRP